MLYCARVALIGDTVKCAAFYLYLNCMHVVSPYTLKLSDILFFSGKANMAGCHLWDEAHIICCK